MSRCPSRGPNNLYVSMNHTRRVRLLQRKTGLSPQVIYYWPFQGDASVVVYSNCQCSSAFCLSLTYLFNLFRIALCHLLGKRWSICFSLDVLFLFKCRLKAMLTFKCLTERLFGDFSFSRPIDTYMYLCKLLMKMNMILTSTWCYIDKDHLLFTKRKSHEFSWPFLAYHCSLKRRMLCA